MDDAASKIAVTRRPPSDKPYPSWSDLLVRLGRDRDGSRGVEAPAAREWRDLVADMIAGRK